MKLTLMFREYCSLCHKMKAELLPYKEAFGFELEVLDVDDHPDLEEKYNELVPVLLDGDEEICHWFLDTDKLRAHLQNRMG
ncbi:TPA: glutaredoxin family protein [Neisseria oralis]